MAYSSPNARPYLDALARAEPIKEAIKACLAVRSEKGMPLTVLTREVEVQV